LRGDGSVAMNRVVNESIISYIDKHYRASDKPLFILYEAPTGYGKTTVAPKLGEYATEAGLSYGYIHVLPMRSIIRDLYGKLKEKYRDTCYQAGGARFGNKNPFLSCQHNLTTFDSFFLNLIRIGVGEQHPWIRHYEVARSMIFSSTTVFDESHLYGGDPGSPETILYTSFIASLASVAYSRSPIMIASATLSKDLASKIYSMFETLANSVDADVLWIRYGEYVKSSKPSVDLEYIDKEYDKIVNSVKWSNKIVKKEGMENPLDRICKNILEDYLSGKRVLAILNKPSRAIYLYNCLSNHVEPLLIHGRMRYSDRERNEKEIKSSRVLIATQVAEAGLDEDFHTLYTDIAFISNLVQRAGRVNRRFEREEASITIVVEEDAYKNVYEEQSVWETLKVLTSLYESINWRDSNTVSKILDTVFSNLNYSPQIKYNMIVEILYNALHYAINISEPLKFLYQCCKNNEGIVRSSILIPLVYKSPDLDIDDKEKDMTIDLLDRIYENTIPVSLDWIIYNIKKLFNNTIQLIIFEKSKEKEYSVVKTKEIEVKPDTLRNTICEYISGRERGLFLGILLEPEKYAVGKGLII